MRVALSALAFACLGATAHAQEFASDPTVMAKLCIFSAARQLPPVPGLTITASRTKPAPASPEKDKHMLYVEIDFDAATLSSTYNFLCGIVPGKSTVTKLIAITR